MKINDYRQFDSEYDCKEVRDLLLLYVLNRGDLSLDERNHIGSHLEKCASCREEYEQTRFVNDVLIANRDFFIREKGSKNSRSDTDSEPLSDEEVDFLQFQGKLERAFARRKRAERRTRLERLRPALKIASAVAACLVVGLGIFWTVSQYNRTSEDSLPVASAGSRDSVKIELISGGHVELLPTDQPILALNELKTLRINDNRQMVLNIGTELSIESYNLGCIVKLDQGEIYTEVEHDGKPFVVETLHGRAVITGTTFHIKADQAKMDLVVIEGSVRFESDKGVIEVKGGYQSSIISGVTPTKPVACNVAGIFQWAKGHETGKSILVNQPDDHFSEMLDLPVSFVPFCDLDKIDFEVWIDKHRQWFEREFPWTKRLQKLLAEKGIEVDTIDLLIESGELWRFGWPEYSRQRVLAEDPEIIQKMTTEYGIGINELIPIELLVQVEQSSSIKALERWLSVFDENKGTVATDSIHAAIFLINTRSLIWYAVDKDNIQIENKQQVLDLLAEQVKMASNMLGVFNQIFLANKSESVCSAAQYEQDLRIIQDGITFIIKLEKLMCSDVYQLSLTDLVY